MFDCFVPCDILRNVPRFETLLKRIYHPWMNGIHYSLLYSQSVLGVDN